MPLQEERVKAHGRRHNLDRCDLGLQALRLIRWYRARRDRTRLVPWQARRLVQSRSRSLVLPSCEGCFPHRLGPS